MSVSGGTMRHVLPITLAAILAAIPAESPACAIAERDGQSARILGESALIVWDEASKTEHFIREVRFESTAYDLGFLVPTPGKPEVEESDDQVFAQLANLTRPRIE